MSWNERLDPPTWVFGQKTLVFDQFWLLSLKKVLVNDFWIKNFELLTDSHLGCEDCPPPGIPGVVSPLRWHQPPPPGGWKKLFLNIRLLMRFEEKTWPTDFSFGEKTWVFDEFGIWVSKMDSVTNFQCENDTALAQVLIHPPPGVIPCPLGWLPVLRVIPLFEGDTLLGDTLLGDTPYEIEFLINFDICTYNDFLS